MQNLVKVRNEMFEVAKKLVDIACENSFEGSYVFYDGEIEEMLGRDLVYDEREQLVKCLHCDERVLDVDADYYAEICIYLATDYVNNTDESEESE